MLLENGGVLGQQSLLFHCDNVGLTSLLLTLVLQLGRLGFSLGLVDGQLLLPETLDLSLVFQLAHASPLSIHLLELLVLSELLHQLALEFFLHAFLFFGALLLESELVFSCSLQFLANVHALLGLSTLLSLGGLFSLLEV